MKWLNIVSKEAIEAMGGQLQSIMVGLQLLLHYIHLEVCVGHYTKISDNSYSYFVTFLSALRS